MTRQEAPPGRRITDKEAENITRVEELAYELRVQEVMTRRCEGAGTRYAHVRCA